MNDEISKRFKLGTIKATKKAQAAVRELTEAIETGRPAVEPHSLADDFEEEFGGKAATEKEKSR